MKIILRMPNWIGDFVMATPLIEDIKRKYPKAFLAVLCKKYLIDLIKYNRYVDKIYFLEKGIEKRLKKERFDIGILLTNSFSSAYLFWKSKIKKRIGFVSDFRFFLLNEKIFFPKKRKSQHLVITYKELLKPLKIDVSKTAPKIFFDKKDEKKIDELLKKEGYKKGPIVSMALFSTYGNAKSWPIDRYYKLAKKLLKEGVNVIFLGDKKRVKEFSISLPKAINLIGKTTLTDLVYVIKKSDVFVSNDTGPMHIAASLDIPLVAIFGSSDEKVTGPYKKEGVICRDIFCRPCFKKSCKDFSCMNLISVEEVMNKIKEKLYV